MKTKTTTRQKACGAVISSLAFLGVLFLAPSVYAATVFFDDFEDGNHDGWLHTVITGSRCCSGTTGVELHNSSMMAFVKHPGNGQDSLSKDFSYLANDILSFDMHAVANVGSTYNGTVLNSMSGVKITFLNFLNSSLGSITIANATNTNWLSPTDISIDSTQHNYTGLLGDYAAAAGLGTSDPITKFSLEFFATAQYSWGGNIYPNGLSSASVWFDNVSVSTIPVPPAVWLFGSGLIGLIGIARRKKI